MTSEQYVRWNSFARRMAVRYPGRLKRAYRAWLVQQVTEFFATLRWNDSQARTFGGSEEIPLIESWDESAPCEEEQRAGRYQSRMYVCDSVSSFLEELNPHRWGKDRDYERWDERHGGRIRCCLRAALDLAASPSAGVVGFTVGDLKRFYPRRGLPGWLRRGWRDRRGRFAALDGDSKGVWL